MLRVALSITVLAGLAVATPLSRSAADDQLPELKIKGSAAYEASGALPADSRLVVELRHLPALANAPAVAEKRIALEGQKSPVSFELAVDRFKLVGGAAYIVRLAIVSEKRAIWTADDIKVDVTPNTLDVKEIKLTPAKAGRTALEPVRP